MKERTFLQYLGKLKGKFKLEDNSCIRTKNKYKMGSYIKNMCPIERVFREVEGKNKEYYVACDELKIDLGLRLDIVNAADIHTIRCDNPLLRKKMLKVLGLEEKE